MALQFPPSPGTILRCDFTNFKEPEMTKSRAVVVLSPRVRNIIRTTFLIVPLSTTEPYSVYDYHLKVTLPGDNIPKGLKRECWVKGDMLYSLSPERLEFYHFERDKNTGKRSYYKDKFTNNDLFNIRKAVMCAVGFNEK